MYYKSLYPPLPQFHPQNAFSSLCARPDQSEWPNFPLHVDALTGTTRSFREFIDVVRDGATAMAADVELGGLGIRPANDELVGILCENCMDCIALHHSLLVMTVPWVMFSSYSTPFEFQQMFKLTAPTRLFVTPAFLHLALESRLPVDRIYILEGSAPGHTSHADLVRKARNNKIPRLAVQPVERDTLAHLIFSSGTSGLPKAIMISHGNLIDSNLQLAAMAAETLKIRDPPKWNGPDGRNVIFSVLPMHHSYGLHLTTFKCFFSPSTLLLLPTWDPDLFFECIPRYRVTTIYLVPSLIHQVVHNPKFPTTDFSNVQLLNSGAAHLPVSLAEKLRARFPAVPQVSGGYGLSECTLIVSLKPTAGALDGRAKSVPASVGILLPGVEARIVREDGSLAALNEPGELHVRSGCVALGYWKNEKATDETFKDGWLRTGDRLRIDADGVLYFEDRVKDTLKISGMQVSPVEIEETLRAHPGELLIDVAVTGVSGGRTEDERVPRAWVVLSAKGKALGAADVIARLDAWIRETLSRYKWLRGGIVVTDQIPKSPTGKVLRRVLESQYEAGLRTWVAAKM